MRVLFDQGTPVPLRGALLAHVVATASEMGWSNLSNGELLDAAEAQFDLLITTDRSLRYQQNLAGRRLSILVLPYANWPLLQSQLPKIVATVDAVQPGSYVELSLP